MAKRRANRAKMIMVRLQPTECARIKAAAQIKGLALSAYVRMIVLDHINQQVTA